MQKAVIFVSVILIGVFFSTLSISQTTAPKKTVKTKKTSFKKKQKVIKNNLGMRFVYVPPGIFYMGTGDRACNARKHKVTITKGFYMQTTEVTQGQFKKIMGYNPSVFKKCGANCPVEKVSYYDAVEFVQKLNELTGAVRYQLPTEAQWEYACRAGSKALYNFGNDFNKLGDYAWFIGNSNKRTHPVGKKKPNAWGIHDMHGNVREWCRDNYGTFLPNPVADPLGTSSDPNRVTRGGNFIDNASENRTAYRFKDGPSNKSIGLGFRLIRLK